MVLYYNLTPLLTNYVLTDVLNVNIVAQKVLKLALDPRRESASSLLCHPLDIDYSVFIIFVFM